MKIVSANLISQSMRGMCCQYVVYTPWQTVVTVHTVVDTGDSTHRGRHWSRYTPWQTLVTVHTVVDTGDGTYLELSSEAIKVLIRPAVTTTTARVHFALVPGLGGLVASCPVATFGLVPPHSCGRATDSIVAIVRAVTPVAVASAGERTNKAPVQNSCNLYYDNFDKSA